MACKHDKAVSTHGRCVECSHQLHPSKVLDSRKAKRNGHDVPGPLDEQNRIIQSNIIAQRANKGGIVQ